MSRPAAIRAVLLSAVVVGLATGAAVFAALEGSSRVALGIATGSGLAFVSALSWLVGALLTFEGPFLRLLRSTVALAPARLFVVLGGIVAVAVFARGAVDLVALAIAFAATHVLFQLVQAASFYVLAVESSRQKGARPVRFGGVKLW